MIVVDASVLASLWIPSEWTETAERILRENAEWAAPLQWRTRLCELLGDVVRREAMTVAAAKRVLSGAEQLLRGQEYAVPIDKVMQCVAESGYSSADCEFVVLAEDLGVPLLTANPDLVKGFPKIARSIVDLNMRRLGCN